MKLNINIQGLALPVSQRLVDIFNQQLIETELPTHPLRGITVCFKDSTYSPENGGYHPVEIGVSSNDEGNWRFEYITDLANTGGTFPELEKEVDFNFLDDKLYSMFLPPLPLSHPDSVDFYQVWESNFISYLKMECYDRVVVTPIT